MKLISLNASVTVSPLDDERKASEGAAKF